MFRGPQPTPWLSGFSIFPLCWSPKPIKDQTSQNLVRYSPALSTRSLACRACSLPTWSPALNTAEPTPARTDHAGPSAFHIPPPRPCGDRTPCERTRCGAGRGRPGDELGELLQVNGPITGLVLNGVDDRARGVVAPGVVAARGPNRWVFWLEVDPALGICYTL